MSLTLNLALTKSALADQANPNSNLHGQSSYDLYQGNGGKRLYLAFEALPANLRNKAIVGVKLSIPFNYEGWNARLPDKVKLYDVASDFSAGSLTWNNQPGGVYDTATVVATNYNIFEVPSFLSSWDGAKRITFPAFYIEAEHDAGNYSVVALLSNAKLIVEYDPDTTVGIDVTAQASTGYVNPRVPQTFAWNINASGGYSYNSARGITQASATFYWRMGTSGSYTAVSVSGSTQSVTIPANTFSAGTVQYYVSVTDTNGNAATSAVQSITTSDAAIAAAASSPINSVEDGGAAITLRWTINSPNGTTPTRIDLRWKLSTDANWTGINNLAGTLRAYTVAGGTFPAGEILWAVRAYNADGTAGSWSATVRFICVAAPGAPGVSTDGAPFATFNWQATGQQAWRLTVDGKLYGPFFGSTMSFTLPDYLADGEHAASVEVQGQYGLWSQPGTIVFTVTNDPGDDVTLQGSFGVDAELSWETESARADFLIYRDGVQIGHTAGNDFADRFVLCEHEWQVVNRLADGNYTPSNAVTGICRSCVTRIAPLEGGDWLALPLSERSNAEQKFLYSRKCSLRHVMGAALPVLELSPFEDGSGSYETAFATVEEFRAFEALQGRVVIIKSRGGRVLIGALTDVSSRMTNFYIAVEFTLQRCHWEDYVNDENA